MAPIFGKNNDKNFGTCPLIYIQIHNSNSFLKPQLIILLIAAFIVFKVKL